MYRFLLRACFLGAVLFMSFADVKGQSYTTKTEKIKLEKDTVWIINTNFTLYKTDLKLTLDFSESASKPKSIKWNKEDNAEETYEPSKEYTHTYTEGLHELILKGADNHIYHYMVFNKMLETDFELHPSPFRYCLESRGDSLLITMENFKDNPPGTKYDIIVKGIDKTELIEEGVTKLCKDTVEWFGPELDSAWIVFYHETGVKSCDVRIRMSYSDKEKNIDLMEETNPQNIAVYRAPNVKKIFDFNPEEGKEFMEVCTGEEQTYLQLNEGVLNFYQCKLRSSKAVPYYDSHDESEGLEIHYYYSDTLYQNMPESNWREVTGYADTVSLDQSIVFKTAGYYKMMMTAQNICNEAGNVKIDTLWTDVVEGEPDKHRYFRVYSYDEGKIVCKTQRACMNLRDEIKIVDYNSRRGFEAPPKYTFGFSFPAPSPFANRNMDNVAETTVQVWRNGQRIEDMPGSDEWGCDSTVICIKLLDDEIYGTMSINMSRENHCDALTKEFLVDVGRKPLVPELDLYQKVIEDYQFIYDESTKRYDHCDTLRYEVPIEFLTQEKNEQGFSLDSVWFYFQKGTAKLDSLNWNRGEDVHSLVLKLDSTDVNTILRIRSHNVCGQDQKELNLWVNGKPKMELLRDAVSKNDSLCIGLDYPYYWKGTFPKRYVIQMPSPAEVFVNGEKREGGTEIELKNGDDIRYEAVGLVEEHFVIKNTRMPECAMDSVWKLELLALPDTLLHRDSVGYCAGLSELNTLKLFKSGKSDFKWGEWKLNAGEERKEKLPVFNLTGKVDTLRYKLSRSKGCYVQGELLLRPRAVPKLKLKDEASYCLPATIVNFRTESKLVEEISPRNDCNNLTVYENSIDPVMIRYDENFSIGNSNYVLAEEPLVNRLIYKIENILVDTAFMGKCRIWDTVSLKISAPKLKVNRTDELRYPWEKYEFANVLAHGLVDTAQLDPASLQWKLVPEGIDFGTGLYGGAYTLTEADKQKDTLKFEVSAESYCGDKLKDTLYVELIHLKIQGYKDTICSNEKGYPLWEKVRSSHVDPSSVRWKIVYPEKFCGELTQETGTDVKYKPGDGTEFVRIWFEAAIEGGGETLDATVELKINPAPRLRFTQDTLWACGQRIDLKKIAAAYLDTAHIAGIGRGDYVMAPGQTVAIGGWSSDDYTFSGSLDIYDNDLFQRVAYEAEGLPGCQNVLDTVVLAQPVPAKVVFKRAHEEMCAGDHLQLDTLYTVKGEDRFIRYAWSYSGEKEGNIENNIYEATEPEDKVQELHVVTHKEYTCYDGNSSGKVLSAAPVTLLLTVHHEPEFKVMHTHDTLCREQEIIHIKQDWVFVESGHYPDYRDSVLVNGSHLGSGGMLYSVNEEGAEEKLVVSIAQGRCTNWKERNATISLLRLPAMITGTIPELTVCEGKPIEVPQPRFYHLVKPIWTCEGGEISQGDDGKVMFMPMTGLDDEGAKVMVTVNPPNDCPKESVTGIVKVGRMPRLKEHNYVFCQVAGHTATVSGELVSTVGVVLTGIRWFRIGTPDEEISIPAQNHDLELVVTDADLTKSPLLLRAEMHYAGACSGMLNDTVRITWQEEPVIDVDPDITVCQASSTGVALGQKVSVRNTNAPTSWELLTTDKGTWDGDQLIFKPGDVSGMVELTVTAQGMATCPPKTETVNIEILAAPLSGGIYVEGEHCSTRELSMKPENEQADNGYTWQFGDGNTGTGVPAKNSYEQPGTYTVTMTGQFRNGCWREETKELTVHLRPSANFTMPNPAPVTRPTEIMSTSTPEDVTCNWRIDGITTYSGSSVSHQFSSEGTHSVLLVVETPEGCKNTARLNPKALAAPVAKFEAVVNPCTGKMEKLENLSELHEATIAWDFGDGSSVSHDEVPAEHTYPLAYKDTTYTIRLRLENISDTVEYTQKVSITSKLEPDFEVWEPDHCITTDKEIRIKTRGKAEKTTIDWGDNTEKQEWTLNNQVSVLSHTYPENESPASENYTITLTAENACHQPAPVTEVVTIVPVTAKAVLLKDVDTKQYQNTCFGNKQAFWNKSFGFISQGYACEWDFGDGTSLVFDTVTTKSKAHLFEKPGVYQVRLRVKDECNTKLDTLTVTVIGNDSLDFAFDRDRDNLCTGDSVRIWFVQREGAPFANLKWTLPDGTHQSNVNTLYYKFKKPGERLEVTLEAEADGCPKKETRQCVVRQTPEPLIEFTRKEVNIEDCTPLSLPFMAVNGEGGTENMRFLWDFGDGSSSTERVPPVKVFEREGSYKVKLEMEASYGCVGRGSLTVTAKVTPTAAFVLNRHLICSDEGDFEITAFNRTASAENCSFEWYKGNEVVSINPDSASVSFVGFYGKERIALRATHKLSGCDSRMIDSIVASHPLKASLSVSPDTVCAGMEVVFRDTLSLAGVTREFYFDDGSLDDSREVSKTYWEPGKYAYRFVQRNADGCTDTLRDMVFVHTLPVAEFDWQEEILPVEIGNLRPGTELPAKGSNGIRFTSRSTLAPLEGEGSGLYYIWDFGDGQIAREREPAHRFENNGVYDVRLYAVTEQGCRDSISHLVEIATFKGLFFPNAMVPASSDPGVNRFQPKGIGLHAFTLKVYGPDGSCVWQTDKLDAGKPAEYWDGTYNGQPVPAGVYNWEASALFIDGTVQNHINGALIVIR